MAFPKNFANIIKTWLEIRSSINFLHSRNISCFHTPYSKYLAREARVMRKMLGEKTEKKLWYKSDGSTSLPIPRMNVAKCGQNHRRIAVLNKLFMRHITDMMASGEVGNEILGRGIEISRVKVAPDFNKVNVFWLARGTENDVEVESILKRSAGHLRHQLSELRVMGVVPYIEFVKDTQYAKVVEVERILATADFGEDYVPVGAGCQLKSEFTMHTHLPPNIKSHIEKVEDEIPEPSLPPMRMDVLGLRHEEIMNKIRNSVKKSHALHRHDVRIPLQNFTNSESVQQNLEDANHDIFNLKKEDFTKFLKKRHFLHKKALCSKKNYRPELELHENEVLEGGTVVSDFLDSVREEKDYVDDSEDVKL